MNISLFVFRCIELLCFNSYISLLLIRVIRKVVIRKWFIECMVVMKVNIVSGIVLVIRCGNFVCKKGVVNMC